MRINNISNNVNFGQVTLVKTSKNKKNSEAINDAVIEVTSVLNNQKSHIYSKEESDRIREFFRGTIQDYTGYNVVLTRTVGDDTYLVTGSEAKDVMEYERAKRRERKEIRKTERDSSKRSLLIEETYNDVDNMIKDKARQSSLNKAGYYVSLSSVNIENGIHPKENDEIKFDKFDFRSNNKKKIFPIEEIDHLDLSKSRWEY